MATPMMVFGNGFIDVISGDVLNDSSLIADTPLKKHPFYHRTGGCQRQESSSLAHRDQNEPKTKIDVFLIWFLTHPPGRPT